MLNSKDAKYGFGRFIGRAHATPPVVTKNGQPVNAALSVEVYEHRKALDTSETRPETEDRE